MDIVDNIWSSLNMARIGFGFISSRDIGPWSYPDDTVVPINDFDNNFLVRNQFIRLVLRVDCALDDEKLRCSLEELITEHRWTKCGARLHMTDGKLQGRIPTPFTPDRRPFRYDKQDLRHTSISEHNVSGNPSDKKNDYGKPMTVSDPESMARFFDHLNHLRTIEAFISCNKDIPMLGLSLVLFKDATLICISTPHILMDGAAINGLLKAWTTLLSNKPEEIVKTCDFGTDALRGFGLSVESEYWLRRQQLSTFNFLSQYVAQNLTTLVLGTEQRMICIPPSFLRKLEAEISRPAGNVSEGDIVGAWWTRIVAKQCMPRLTQTVTLYQLLSISAYLPHLFPERKQQYIGNAIGYVPTLFQVQELLKQPLGRNASTIRHSLLKSTQRAQLEAYASLLRSHTRRVMPTFGNGLNFTVVISNLTKFRMLDIDFSGARIATPSLSSHPEKPCQYSPTLGHSFQHFHFPNFFTIFGKDHDGNMWLSGNMSRRQWDNVDKEWRENHLGLVGCTASDNDDTTQVIFAKL